MSCTEVIPLSHKKGNPIVIVTCIKAERVELNKPGKANQVLHNLTQRKNLNVDWIDG